MSTVQRGGVNQDVVTAVTRKFTNRNLGAGASERLVLLQVPRGRVILLRLFHLLAKFGIHSKQTSKKPLQDIKSRGKKIEKKFK